MATQLFTSRFMVGSQHGSDSLQTSPAAVVAVLSYNRKNLWDFRALKPYDLDNECTVVELQHLLQQVHVTNSKRSHLKGMTATFTDPHNEVNSAVASGDWIFVWMFDNQEDADETSERLRLGKEATNGLKFFGRVKSVRSTISRDPESGKIYRFASLSAASFAELDTKVYFNPRITPHSGNSDWLVMAFSNARELYNRVTLSPYMERIDEILPLMLDGFLGVGTNQEDRRVALMSPNRSFPIPSQVANIFGIENIGRQIVYGDLITSLIGIQRYEANSNYPIIDDRYSQQKSGSRLRNRLWTPNKILSVFNPVPTPWNNVSVWSIMASYINPAVNEMYTCLRPNRDGKLRPHLILRQKPFNTDAYVRSQATEGRIPATAFSNLPRWVIGADRVLNANLGRADAERVNYVEVQLITGEGGIAQMHADAAMANGFFTLNPSDIQRHGLHPYIVSVQSYYLDLVDAERRNMLESDVSDSVESASNAVAHTTGPVITSKFSTERIHPKTGEVRPHKGVDIRAPEGTPIGAAAAGKVVRSAVDPNGWGEYIVIDHGAIGPAGEIVFTLYAHLQRRNVNEGKEVSAGEFIGLSGKTGSATGPHLHFEVRYLDPNSQAPDAWRIATPVNPESTIFANYTPGEKVFGAANSELGQIFRKYTENKQSTRNKTVGYLWSNLLADQLFHQHLKYNGTLSVKGIQEPIAEGDNIEFEGMIFHIEQVDHVMYRVDESGKKSFHTTLYVSNGVPLDPAQFPDIYPLLEGDFVLGPEFQSNQRIV